MSKPHATINQSQPLDLIELIRWGLVFVCIVVVGILLYQSMSLKQSIPEYALTFFSSIASLIIGYNVGAKK